MRGLLEIGETGLAGRVRLNVAAALLWQDRYREAETWLIQARAELAEAQMGQEVALAGMSLSTCSLHSGRPAQAILLATEAGDVFRAEGSRHFALQCDSNVAQAYLQLGRADEALDILLRLREGYAGSPIDQVRVEEFLGDAFIRLNMPEEAANAYESALRHPALRALPLNRANCLLGLSWSKCALGLAADARRAARRSRRAYTDFGNRVWSQVAALSESNALALGGVAGAWFGGLVVQTALDSFRSAEDEPDKGEMSVNQWGWWMAIAMGALRFRLLQFMLMCVAGNLLKAMIISYAGYLGVGTLLRLLGG